MDHISSDTLIQLLNEIFQGPEARIEDNGCIRLDKIEVFAEASLRIEKLQRLHKPHPQ